jgi:hypothetical protein
MTDAVGAVLRRKLQLLLTEPGMQDMFAAAVLTDQQAAVVPESTQHSAAQQELIAVIKLAVVTDVRVMLPRLLAKVSADVDEWLCQILDDVVDDVFDRLQGGLAQGTTGLQLAVDIAVDAAVDASKAVAVESARGLMEAVGRDV